MSGSIARRIRSLAIDLTPLRARDFRLLWVGEIVSETGSSITLIAVYVQVYRLTGSAAAVGLIGLVQLVPLMIGSLFGGPVIDRHDRRRLLRMAQVAQAGGSILLLIGALMDPTPVVVVYVGAAVIAGLSGFALATRSAMTPTLVPPERLPSALALNQAMYQTALIVGPALGGVLIGQLGLSWAYAVDVATFGAAITAVSLMRPHPPLQSAEGDDDESDGWQRLVDGFRFLKGRRVLQSTFGVDLIAMIFGMPRSLFPILAVTQFHAGAEAVGLLFSAVSVGALVGALSSGWVHRVPPPGDRDHRGRGPVGVRDCRIRSRGGPIDPGVLVPCRGGRRGRRLGGVPIDDPSGHRAGRPARPSLGHPHHRRGGWAEDR